MLTDYHVHLRSDDLDATAADHFTAENAARYRAAARERGIAELGVSEHVYRFSAALEIWQHPFWRENATDDLERYCSTVRAQTDLRLGIEADFIPGREQQIAQLLAACDFDYVVGSVHFVARNEDADGFFAVDMEEYGAWRAGWSAEELWRSYFETLGAAARSGLFDILAHPDLVKVFGAGHPPPDGDLRRFYEPAIAGIAESGIAVEVSTAGLRKPAGEIYPAPAFLEMALEAGAQVALSSDAHAPEDIGAGYDRALELLAGAGVSELCVFERRRRRLEPLGRS
jgi:histidinol-phosphatase (PHP family)